MDGKEFSIDEAVIGETAPPFHPNCGCSIVGVVVEEEIAYVTEQQLLDLGWNNVTEALVKDLNFALRKYDITTPERIRHFMSQCAHESGLGLWTKELANGQDYEGRSDLGNINPGDGPKFKGAGYIQLTGRYNYQRFAEEMGDPKVMEGIEYVANHYPWTCSGFWWHNNDMNALVDSGASVYDVTSIVNGALNGLAEREEYYRRLCEIIK